MTEELGHNRTREAGLWSPESASLFRPDPKLLDERPPFLGIGLHERAERIRSLLVTWKISIPRSTRRSRAAGSASASTPPH